MFLIRQERLNQSVLVIQRFGYFVATLPLMYYRHTNEFVSRGWNLYPCTSWRNQDPKNWEQDSVNSIGIALESDAGKFDRFFYLNDFFGARNSNHVLLERERSLFHGWDGFNSIAMLIFVAFGKANREVDSG